MTFKGITAKEKELSTEKRIAPDVLSLSPLDKGGQGGISGLWNDDGIRILYPLIRRDRP